MKKLFPIITILACLFLMYNCQDSPEVIVKPSPSESPKLEGTWKLVKTKWGDMKEHKVPRREIYKIFTKEHFFFIYIDGKQVSGAGGGTYVSTDSSFTESLQYYSWDHSAVGTKQQFNYTTDGNQLHQTGMIKNTDKYDNYVIDEYFEKVEEGISAHKAHPLAGVWKYTNGDGNTSAYIRDHNLRAMKVFTSKYWYAVFTEKESGEYHGVGFGKYELDNRAYTEHIEAFSFDSTAVGQTYTFTLEQQPNQLTQTGMINTDQYQNFTVEENYQRIE